MKLSICMMVKNEEKNLPRCLKSLEPLRKLVESELIIIDTGSTDSTVGLVRSFTDQVYFHEWNHNFSEMRNKSISYARGEWILIIDADEEIEDARELLEFLALKSNSFNGACVKVKNITGEMEENSSFLNSPRLFRNDGYFHYEGAVHNEPKVRGVFRDLKTVFFHYGYMSNDRELMERKFRRTSELLVQVLEKDPENLYYRYQLSVSYRMHNDFSQALAEIRKAYNIFREKGYDPKNYLYLYHQLILCQLDAKNLREAEQIAKESIAVEPEYPDLHFFLGKIEGMLKNYQESRAHYLRFLDLAQDFNHLKIRLDGRLSHYTLERINEAYHDLAVASLEEKDYKAAFSYLGRVTKDEFKAKVADLMLRLGMEAPDYPALSQFYDQQIRGTALEKNFLAQLEIRKRSLEQSEMDRLTRAFAEGSGDYAQLNTLRLAYRMDPGGLKPALQAFVQDFDFNTSIDVYGEILYFFMKSKSDLAPVFQTVSRENLAIFLDYLRRSFPDYPQTVFSYLAAQELNQASGILEIKIHWSLAGHLLRAAELKTDDYLPLFRHYLDAGILYLHRLYQDEVLEKALISEVKNSEEAFFLYMALAQRWAENGDELGRVRHLRQALQVYPQLSRGIELELAAMKQSASDIQTTEQAEFDEYKREVKKKIETLIEQGQLEAAGGLIREYEEIVPDDLELYSIKAVLAIQANDLVKAEKLLLEGQTLAPDNFDLLYNLGYVYEMEERFEQALDAYRRAITLPSDDEMRRVVGERMNNIHKRFQPRPFQGKKKLTFFVKPGLDSFLGDIIHGLSDQYVTKRVVVTNLKQIDVEMAQADICWFEWCDELIGYGSKHELAKSRIIICRLHRYEVFTDYPANVDWKNVDKLIVVAEHLSQLLRTQFPQTREVEIITIKNGVDLAKFMFLERHTGFNLSYIGYIHARKNPSLLLQIIERLVKIDKRYKLFVAGEFQDRMVMAYWEYQVRKMDLQEHVIFDGWQKDIGNWLKDKNYVLSTSMHESFGYGIAEAMVCGIKPVIHNFAWADEVWDEAYLFNSIEEAVTMIVSGDYNSFEYNDFVKKNYSLDLQLHVLKSLLGGIIEPEKKTLGEFSYSDYWNQRLNNMFDIEGVGYIGLGKVYNEYLYRSRIEMLSYLAKSLFGSLNNKNVLEVGPGIGMFTQQFNNQKIKGYYGIDISAKAVQHLSDRYKRFYFTHGDVSDPTKYPTEFKADLVFAAAVLLHITDELNFVRTIKNLVAVLQPNGYMIFMEPISATGATSLSEHVVIRSYEFMEKVLNEQGLEIVGCLPLTFFMNFPFDQKLIGDKGDSAIEAFNAIGKFIEYTKENPVQQDYVSRYLYIMDKICLLKYKMGLSEKALIIRKKSHNHKPSLQTENIWSLKQLNQQKQRLFKELLDQKDLLGSKLVSDTLSSVYRLLPDDDTEPTFAYLRRTLEEFSPYTERYANEFALEGSEIRIGKRERVTKDIELIEGILSNSYGNQLLLEGVWHQVNTNEFFLPKYLNNSCNRDYYLQLVNKLSTLELSFSNGIAGFIYDQDIAKDVERNIDAYMWERGIPATQFMPVLQYLKIIERYKFASQFIRKSDFVLEAGAGYGYGAAYLSSLCRKVEALDKAKDNIEFGTKTYNFSNIQWTEGDVTELPYENSSIDVYVSFETLEHLTEEMVSLYFREAVRVLKKRGKMIISTPNRTVRQEIKNPFHIKEYNFAEFDALLKPFFKDIEYYSVKAFKVERNIDPTAFNLLAVCTK